jgi:hypothetical protein
MQFIDFSSKLKEKANCRQSMKDMAHGVSATHGIRIKCPSFS